uniref:Uncharacterized protein n=1 Tax=Micrurus surinamensis TaxID=129470 RepID=A0A2D4P8M7_MICSU
MKWRKYYSCRKIAVGLRGGTVKYVPIRRHLSCNVYRIAMGFLSTCLDSQTFSSPSPHDICSRQWKMVDWQEVGGRLSNSMLPPPTAQETYVQSMACGYATVSHFLKFYFKMSTERGNFELLFWRSSQICTALNP